MSDMSMADFAARVCGMRPLNAPTKFPDERMDTTTGHEKQPVTVLFNVSNDGEIEDMKVMVGATDIFKALSFEQVEKLEYECWKSYLDDCKERNAELRIESMRAEREEV